MFRKETVGNLLLAISHNKVIKTESIASSRLSLLGRAERGFAPASMSMIPLLHNAYTQNLEILVTVQAAGILNFPAFFPTWDQGFKTSGVPHNY